MFNERICYFVSVYYANKLNMKANVEKFGRNSQTVNI